MSCDEDLAACVTLLRATLEHATDALLVIDAGGAIVHANRSFATTWRIPEPPAAGMQVARAVAAMSEQAANPAAACERIEAVLASPACEVVEHFELRDGRLLESVCRRQPLGRNGVGRIWSFRDRTAELQGSADALWGDASAGDPLLGSRPGHGALPASSLSPRCEAMRAEAMRAEAMRSEAERASALERELFANLSHELRTPLNAILGWAQLLRLGRRSGAELEKGLERIERNARAQTRLVENLLDMSSLLAGNVSLASQLVEPGGFIGAALEAVQPAARAKGVHLEWCLERGAGLVSGDPQRLEQVMVHLLSNAIEFTPAGGAIRVHLARVHSHVEVSVADSGVGIRPGFLPFVFDRFRQADASTTRRHGGVGLGLSLVKRLVELHGGNVRATSAGEGLGATFTVELPLAPAHAAGHASCASPPTPNPAPVSPL